MLVTSSYAPCLFCIETFSIIKETKVLMIAASTGKLTGKLHKSVPVSFPLMKEMKRIQQDTALY